MVGVPAITSTHYRTLVKWCLEGPVVIVPIEQLAAPSHVSRPLDVT